MTRNLLMKNSTHTEFQPFQQAAWIACPHRDAEEEGARTTYALRTSFLCSAAPVKAEVHVTASSPPGRPTRMPPAASETHSSSAPREAFYKGIKQTDPRRTGMQCGKIFASSWPIDTP